MKRLTKEQKHEVIQAEIFGTAAFHNGIKAAALDANMMALLKGKKVGEGIHALKAWNAAYTKALLAN